MEPQPLDSLHGKRLMIQVYMWQPLNTTRSSLHFLRFRFAESIYCYGQHETGWVKPG
ncbi:hypothetical protein BT67DRAFT_393159 [Trichocladium antarcticum]|uniref:Uncharacterized protein n=1 Tax=Trichocladium antarcticum TaxID=1450529 RepID=A0AAN6ZHJ1_9PEZI|nr:hypothetical protein BT67DRAFT_393159 [Trichocladium antarcticum]